MMWRTLPLLLLSGACWGLDLGFPATPLERNLGGAVSNVVQEGTRWRMQVAGRELWLADLPPFVSTRWEGSVVKLAKHYSPAGPQSAAAFFQNEQPWLALGVNMPLARVSDLPLVFTPAGQRIRVQSGAKVLTTLASGQGTSIRLAGQLWCVFARYEPQPAPQPGLAREAVPRLAWLVSRTDSARRCRN